MSFESPENSTYERFVTFSVTDVTFCNVIPVTEKSFICKGLGLILIVVTDVTSILGYTLKFFVILGEGRMYQLSENLSGGICEKPVTNVTRYEIQRNPLYLKNYFVTPYFEKTLQNRYGDVTSRG